LRVPDPDTGGELRYVTTEPCVLEVLGGPRLARDWAGAERGSSTGAARDDALQSAGDLSGHARAEDTPARRMQRDLFPVRPANALERPRSVMDAARGQRCVDVSQFERREPDRSERDRAGSPEVRPPDRFRD